MIIKLDENLGRPHVALLKRYGVMMRIECSIEGLSGVVDAELWVHVKREGRFLDHLLIWDFQMFAATLPARIRNTALRPRRKGRNAVSQVLPNVFELSGDLRCRRLPRSRR